MPVPKLSVSREMKVNIQYFDDVLKNLLEQWATNLRSKRFPAVSKQRTRNESQSWKMARKRAGRGWGRKVRSHTTKPENPVPRSFFVPKPNGIACYAGWGGGGGVTFKLVTLSYHYHYCSFSQLALRRTLLGLAS